MIEYCSNTTMFYYLRGEERRLSLEECLRRSAKIGIKNIDLSLFVMNRGWNFEFDSGDWQDKAKRLRDTAESLGLKFVQTHLPYRSALNKWNYFDAESYRAMKEITVRAMKISNIVGAKWAVAHPGMNENFTADNIDAHLRENHEFYADCINEAEKGPCGLAFENLTDRTTRRVRKYCASAGELVDLIDSFKSARIQGIWDFGHANLTYGDEQCRAIRQMGSRLKAVHVDDNFGQIDDHIAPYTGNIKWEDIYDALADIGYDGYWTFEIGKAYKNLPEFLKDEAMVFYKHLADFMIAEYEKARQRKARR